MCMHTFLKNCLSHLLLIILTMHCARAETIGRLTFFSYCMDENDPIPGLCYSKVCEPGVFDESKASYVVLGSVYPAYIVLGKELKGDIAIPERIEGLPVRKVNAKAFSAQSGITSLTFPSTLREVGAKAFSWCTALTNVTFAEGFEVLGDQAFTNCNSLVSVTFPKTFRRLGREAFVNCDNLMCIIFNGNAPELDEPLALPDNNYDARSYLGEKRYSGTAMRPRAKILARADTYGWKGPYQRGMPDRWPVQYGWTTAHEVIPLMKDSDGLLIMVAQKDGE